jgi:hypothetical protein
LAVPAEQAGGDYMKKDYAKPELKRVELVADQAVLGSCKSTSYGDAQVSGAINCEYGSNQCAMQGS